MERGFSWPLEMFIFLVSRQFEENNSWLTAGLRDPPGEKLWPLHTDERCEKYIRHRRRAESETRNARERLYADGIIARPCRCYD